MKSDGADDDGPRPIPAWIFWTALAFGLTCVVLGAAVGLWGGRLFRPAEVGGAPSRGELTRTFPAAAQAAAAAVRGAGPSPAGRPPEAAPEAVLARAGRAAAAGDLDLAMCDIAALPPASRKAMSSWREAAERRVAADQQKTTPGATARTPSP